MTSIADWTNCFCACSKAERIKPTPEEQIWGGRPMRYKVADGRLHQSPDGNAWTLVHGATFKIECDALHVTLPYCYGMGRFTVRKFNA